jgi:hypothetical protein
MDMCIVVCQLFFTLHNLKIVYFKVLYVCTSTVLRPVKEDTENLHLRTVYDHLVMYYSEKGTDRFHNKQESGQK